MFTSISKFSVWAWEASWGLGAFGRHPRCAQVLYILSKSHFAGSHTLHPARAPGPARDPRNRALAYIILLFSAFGGARRALSSDPAKSPKSCSRLHNIDIFSIRGARRSSEGTLFGSKQIHSSLLQADCSIPGYIRHFHAKTDECIEEWNDPFAKVMNVPRNGAPRPLWPPIQD